MSRQFNVAIVGASGAVGEEILKTFDKRNFPLKSLRLLASSRSAGRQLSFRDEVLTIEELTPESFSGIDIAMFCASGGISREYAKYAVDAGAIVVDNSSVFRMQDDVPLIVPEVNAAAVSGHKGIIANPNCTTTIMLVALKPLYELSRIKRIIVSTYQSASGADAKGMQELEEQTAQYLKGEEIKPHFFQHQYAFNLFSHNTDIDESGYNTEELKMVYETRKILGDEEILVCPTCVRVPVLRSHAESIVIEQERKVSVEEAIEALSNAAGIKLVNDAAANHFPMPSESNEQYDVLVGRIRDDLSHPNALAIFVCGDQLLKGAALNAVQIAELL